MPEKPIIGNQQTSKPATYLAYLVINAKQSLSYLADLHVQQKKAHVRTNEMLYSEELLTFRGDSESPDKA